MKTQPQLVPVTSLRIWNTLVCNKDGQYVPGRPLPYYYAGLRNLRNRLKLAWGVFTGRYDALDWQESNVKYRVHIPGPVKNSNSHEKNQP